MEVLQKGILWYCVSSFSGVLVESQASLLKIAKGSPTIARKKLTFSPLGEPLGFLV